MGDEEVEARAKELLSKWGYYFDEKRSWAELPETERQKWLKTAKGMTPLEKAKVHGITVDRAVVDLIKEEVKVDRAKRAYQRYGDYVGWENAGTPLQKWESLTDKVREAWVAALDEP